MRGMSSDGLPPLPKIPKVSDIPPDQVTPLVLWLLEIIHHQQEQMLRRELRAWTSTGSSRAVRR